MLNRMEHVVITDIIFKSSPVRFSIWHSHSRSVRCGIQKST